MINFTLGDVLLLLGIAAAVFILFAYVVVKIPAWILRNSSSAKRIVLSGVISLAAPALLILAVGPDDISYQLGFVVFLIAFVVAIIIEWRRGKAVA